METAMSQRQRLFRFFTLWGGGLLVAGAWLALWEFVLTPFDRGTFLYHLCGGLGIIVVYWALIAAVPALRRQATQEMSTRGMILLTAVSALMMVGWSLLSAWAAS
jgi:hypothetical protein